jgi:hypothetical protein
MRGTSIEHRVNGYCNQLNFDACTFGSMMLG